MSIAPSSYAHAGTFLIDSQYRLAEAEAVVTKTKAVLERFPHAKTHGVDRDGSLKFDVAPSYLDQMDRFDPRHYQESGDLAFNVLYTEVQSDAGPVRVYASAAYNTTLGFDRYYANPGGELYTSLAQAMASTVEEAMTKWTATVSASSLSAASAAKVVAQA